MPSPRGRSASADQFQAAQTAGGRFFIYFQPRLEVLTISQPGGELASSTSRSPKITIEALDGAQDDPVPLFHSTAYPEKTYRVLFVGIGLETLGLSGLFESTDTNLTVNLLLPFPPGPPNFHRNLEFIRKLGQNLSKDKRPNVIRVNPWDVSDCFQHIVASTSEGK